MPVRTTGGIISDQNLTGSLLFFKITNGVTGFGWTISDGTVNLNSLTKGAGGQHAGAANPTTLTTTYFQVGTGRPIPGSVAEQILAKLSQKCNIVQIGMVGANQVTEIDIAVSATGFGWIDAIGDPDTGAMQTAINGTYNAVPKGGAANQNTAPATENITVGATVTKSIFKLV